MSVKLPMPTQFDGRNAQFREWSGEVKAYLTIHNVHIEDYMDESAKSIEATDIRNIKEVYVTEDVQYRDNKFPSQPTEDEADEFEEYNDLTMTIRKKRDDHENSQWLRGLETLEPSLRRRAQSSTILTLAYNHVSTMECRQVRERERSHCDISDWKETTMVIGNIIMQVKFIVANVQSPLIGLPVMDCNELAMRTGNEPHIEQYGHNEPTMKTGSHLYVAAMVLPERHNHEEVQVASSICTRYSASSQSQLTIREVEDLSNQAYVPRQLRHPHQPTTIEAMAEGAAPGIRDTILNGQLYSNQGSFMDKIALINAWSDIMPLNRIGMTHADYAASQVETTWYMVLRRCDLARCQYPRCSILPTVAQQHVVTKYAMTLATHLLWNHEDGEYRGELFALCVKATTAQLLEFEDETVPTTLYVRRGEDVSVEHHCNTLNTELVAIHLEAMVGNVFMTLHYDVAAMAHVVDIGLVNTIWLDRSISIFVDCAQSQVLGQHVAMTAKCSLTSTSMQLQHTLLTQELEDDYFQAMRIEHGTTVSMVWDRVRWKSMLALSGHAMVSASQ
eukprot:3161818-Amphidinium_carterae.1